jgi:hypothetical protein
MIVPQVHLEKDRSFFIIQVDRIRPKGNSPRKGVQALTAKDKKTRT